MRKIIAALFASFLLLIGVSVFYYKNFHPEKISPQVAPPISEHAALVLCIKDFQDFWENISNTNVHKAMSDAEFMCMGSVLGELLKNSKPQKTASAFEFPIFISAHQILEPNTIGYLLYLPKDCVPFASIRGTAPADVHDESTRKIFSKNFTTNGTLRFIHFLELDDFIVISHSKQLLEQYSDDFMSYKKDFFITNPSNDPCSLIINLASLQKLLQSCLLIDFNETNLGKFLMAIPNQKSLLALNVTVMNNCIAASGVVRARSSDTLFLESGDEGGEDYQFYDFRKFFTANMRSLELVSASILESLVEKELKSHSEFMHGKKESLYNLLHVLDKNFVRATLDFLDDSGEVLHLMFIGLRDEILFLDELIADDDIFPVEKNEIPEKVYKINHGGFEKTILKRICPKVSYNYVLVLRDVAILANSYRALSEWYGAYTKKFLWGATINKYLAYGSTSLHVLLDARRLLPDARAYVKNDSVGFAKEALESLGLISLHIAHKEDDAYNISLILSMGR